MQEELLRIRNKDYSHIDQKLYSNLGMTSDLDNTLSQLAELQKYLKSQINSISDQSKKQAALKASRVLFMAAMPNQQSSFPTCKCIQSFQQIYDKITKIKKSFKHMKDNIVRESKDCISDLKQIINENITYLYNISTRKQNQSAKLKVQLFTLQQQVNELKHKNSELILKLEQWQIAKKRRREKMSQFTDKRDGSAVSIYMNTENQLSAREAYNLFEQQAKQQFSFKKNRTSFKHCSSLNTLQDGCHQNQNEIPKLPMPLRRQSSANLIQRPNSIDYYSSCQIKQKKIIQQNQFQTAKNSPKNNKMHWHNEKSVTNPRQKQNEILKLKGAQSKQLRKKSTKKLKLFSLI